MGAVRRDEVTPWGAVLPDDGSAMVDWLVAAEDRWHRPGDEPSVRQHLIDGVPVVETRLHVPGGDVVHRVTVVSDHGGVTLIEITNESPLPVAVALTRPDLWLVRPPTEVPTPGTDLPPGSVVLPLGHRATLRAGLRHDAAPTGPLPGDLPEVNAVVRGWRSLCEQTGRLSLPDTAMVRAWTAARCQAALQFDDDMVADPLGWLLRCTEAVRLGEPAERWLLDVSGAVERLLRPPRRWLGRRGPTPQHTDWDVWRALLGAQSIAVRSGDVRAADDARALLATCPDVVDQPDEAPDDVRAAAWYEDRLVRPLPDGGLALFPAGLPAAWFGAPLEVHDLAVGGDRRLSFALRWHGERPALLWELSGATTPSTVSPPRLSVLGGGLDPGWSSDQASGEALLAVPPGAPAIT